jgi:hypothetical protein
VVAYGLYQAVVAGSIPAAGINHEKEKRSIANPRAYSVDAQNAVASPTKSLLVITSATTVRPEIYDIIIGASATPGDVAIVWYFQRCTAAGTSTAYTPAVLDPADPVSLATAGTICTAEPTYTAAKINWHVALNQRATHRWIADPRGPLKMPATASNGFGCYPVHASFTGNVDATVFYNE